jgi:hypothetical protein
MPVPAARARQRQIAAEIAKLGPCLPGSLVERTTRCGSPRCRCHDDPAQRHGPYPSWIRKVGDRTITRTLSREQPERYRPLFDNSRRLRQLVTELGSASAELIEAEGWQPPRDRRSQSRRRRTTGDSTSTPAGPGTPNLVSTPLDELEDIDGSGNSKAPEVLSLTLTLYWNTKGQVSDLVHYSASAICECRRGDLDSYSTDRAGLIIGPELWLPAA